MQRQGLPERKKRINGIHPEYPPELPELRRLIKITDYDTGTPVTHRIELYRSNRIDCYNVWIDGSLWKERIGWGKTLEALRKVLPRQRSSFISVCFWHKSDPNA
ncbi:hypothetical protein [Amphritea sp.]|uniref:hypothetical protein n=1 Tax=Amphritea sp. TaxID=1872502 RepID=UPI0025C35CC6|nr:hypothetical protein [Amphritea sp.]